MGYRRQRQMCIRKRYYSDAYNNAGTATYFNADQKSIEGQGSAPTDPQIVEFNDATFECMNAFGKAV